VNEVYVKLVDQRRVQWQNRTHFLAIAASAMRRLLVDHARARAAGMRGQHLAVSLDGVDVGADMRSPDLLALDVALDKLGRVDARQARLVELRFFGGLTVDEAAEVLDMRPPALSRRARRCARRARVVRACANRGSPRSRGGRVADCSVPGGRRISR
jgi:RNA polymerase sigma factor (TIGR02999 family)